MKNHFGFESHRFGEDFIALGSVQCHDQVEFYGCKFLGIKGKRFK
jgi:hypothetical protein